jgi:hypothetical protein
MRLFRMLQGVLVVSSVLSCIIAWRHCRTPSPAIASLVQRPGAVEIWQDRRMSLAKRTLITKPSPLVVQAQIYAKLLNPPKPARPVVKGKIMARPPEANPATVAVQPRVKVTPKKAAPNFKVHATSVFAKQPEKSMALISEPGKSAAWIRPGDTLGTLKVIRIRQDAVVYASEASIGEVAWTPGVTAPRSRPKRVASAMAMDVPRSPPTPKSWPPVPMNPRPNRLAAPQTRRNHAASPRPARGGR